MIYIPILKTRKEEYNVIKQMEICFSEKIIPMIEIICEKYEAKYKVDSITGNYIYEKRNKKRIRVKEEPTDEDIITLNYINELVKGKKVFIDYFRFSNKIYGNNVNISRSRLSWKLSNDEALYKSKIKEISHYSNMIPVISIKQDFDMGKNEIKDFVIELQSLCKSIALRITEEWIDKYSDIIEKILRKEDYILLDIGEQNPEAKFMEIEQINEMERKAQFILINSPRKRENRNGEFPQQGETNLINNCAKEIAKEYEIDGYGDYCGLKDIMPLNDGSNGTGVALALFYNFQSNTFFSYANHNTSQGVKGYQILVPKILKDANVLDPQNDCPGLKKIKTMKGYGNWSTWHNINAIRYIYQVYKYL